MITLLLALAIVNLLVIIYSLGADNRHLVERNADLERQLRHREVDGLLTNIFND